MTGAQARQKSGRVALFALAGLIVLATDQATKYWFEHHFDPGERVPVTSFFNLVLAHNRGAAFSFLADAGGWQHGLFSVLALVVAGLLAWLVRRHADRTLFAFAATLVAAGALGNLIDRTVYGYVVDFLDFYWGAWHWPAFNVADIAICCGAGLMILDEFTGLSKR